MNQNIYLLNIMAHDLYCSEEHWEENIGVDELLEYNECVSDSTTSTIINSNSNSNLNYPLMLLEQDMFWEDEELTSLLGKEEHNPLHTCIEYDTELEGERIEAVLWMLKVNGHYSFSALTAILGVNYLDRFLSSFRFQNRKPWMIHLAAVACLSLAAKVEETQVPLLLDLQVEDSKYLFEAKTIKKMEILVLSTLGWKMNPPTPLSFLHYIITRLGFKNDFNLCFQFLTRCESLLISLIPDSRFMSYLPSELATATIMHVINSVGPSIEVEYINQLLGILGTNKEKMEECCKAMLEVRSGYEEGKKRKFGSIPSSPSGVIDVSFSSDSSNESWTVSTSAPASVSSSPEPLFKKTRTQHQLLLNYSTSQFLTIPR